MSRDLIRDMVADADNRTTAYLVSNGIPFDVAESWPDEERRAFCIIFGEINGGTWDWDRMRWEKPKG